MKVLRASLEMQSTLDVDSWVIQDAVGGLTVLWGPSGSYKTFVALSMAVAVASGRSWYGRLTIQRPVLYIVGEGGWGKFLYRLMALTKEWGLTAGEMGTFSAIPSPVDLSRDSKEKEELFAWIDEEDPAPGLIVVDTLSRCLPGDENKQEAMQGFVNTLDTMRDRWGSAVLVLHHANLQGRIRGSTVLTGAADVSIAVKRTSDGANRLLALRADKLKELDLDDFEPKKLFPVVVGVIDSMGEPALDSFGAKVTTLVMRDAPEMRDREQVAFDVFTVLASQRPADQAVGYREWLEGTELPEVTFKRALGALLSDKKITKVWRGHYFLWGKAPVEREDVVLGSNYDELDPMTRSKIEDSQNEPDFD